MKLNFVNSVSEAIMRVQNGRVTICEFAQPQGFSPAHQSAERVDSRFTPRPALTPQCFLQLRVMREQIVVLEGRRLIKNFVGRSAGVCGCELAHMILLGYLTSHESRFVCVRVASWIITFNQADAH